MAVTDRRPLVLIDVDGVVNRARFLSSRQRDRLVRSGQGWVSTWSGERHYSSRIVTTRAYGRMLLPLAERAELAWATTWTAEANWRIGPLIGLPELRYSPVSDKGGKAACAVAFTEGRPWAWLDDTQEELALASALSRGRPHLPVLVSRETGLVQENVDEVAAWLEGL